MSQDLRIFISSPGDVTPERLIAKRIIERLAREFKHHCKIEPVLWERQPLIATEHFQTTIDPPPSKTEIVVVVIWSRLGTPLPLNEFPGPVTGGEVTGTEWEFEDAVNSYRQRKLPDILLYRKLAPVMASLEDDAELERQRAQKRMVEDFVRRWFEDEEAGTFKAASHPFQASTEFEDMLETHLRELISRHIDITDTNEGRVRWHEGSPFRGLEAFEIEHAPIFFGRTRARNELREVLVRQASRGCGFVMVFGSSGSGKSSLVKAGLLPDLMLPGMVENVGLCRVALMRPSDNPGDLFAALSDALLCRTHPSQTTEASLVMGLPELAELEYDTTTLASQLRDASNALLPIRQGLKVAHKTAKLADHAEARLAIVVDQLEELFTLDGPEADRHRFVDTLTALARSGQVWVIATMRSDFFDRLARLPELVRLSQGEGRYLLMPPNEAEVGQIIRQPAQAAGLRFETNADGISLDEKLREVAGKDPSALPLLEFTLEQLWQLRSDQVKLTYEAYERLGGMEGALGQRAEEVFQEQSQEVRKALPNVLRALVTVGQGENAAATARTAPLVTFPEGTPQRQLVEAFLDPNARLLMADGDSDNSQVRITHEALLSHWPRAAAQIRTDRQDLQTRTRVEAAFASWEQGDKDKAFLLAEGKPLAEAEDLLVRYRDELDAQTIEFIKASSTRAQRKKRRLVAFAVGAGMLALIAVASAFLALQQSNLAIEKAWEATRRLSIQLTVQAQIALDNYPQRSLLLAREALNVIARENLAPLPVAESALRQSLVQTGGHVFSGHDGPVSVAISLDSSWIATATDSQVRLWRMGGKTSATMPLTLPGAVRPVTFSPNGRWLISAVKDGGAGAWDLTATDPAARAFKLRGHKGPIKAMAIDPAGRWLVTGTNSDHRTSDIRVWDLRVEGLAVDPITLPETARPYVYEFMPLIAFSPDGRWLVTGSWLPKANRSSTSTTHLWFLGTKHPFSEAPLSLQGHMSSISQVAFSPDGQWLATASNEFDKHTFRLDNTIRMWDLTAADPSSAPRILRGHEGPIGALVFSPDGRWLVSGRGQAAHDRFDDSVRIWDLTAADPAADNRVLGGHDDPVDGLAIGRSAGKIQWLVTLSNSTARLWDLNLKNPSPDVLREGTQGYPLAIDVLLTSQDSRWLIAGSSDFDAHIYDLTAKKPAASPRILHGHEGTITSAAISSDSLWVVTGSQDRTARLWNLAFQQPSADGAVLSSDRFIFSPNGRWLVTNFKTDSGIDDQSIRLWDLGQVDLAIAKPHILKGHRSSIYAFGISSDNHWLVTSDYKDSAILWDLTAKDPQGSFVVLAGHIGAIPTLAISSDNRWLVSGSFDKTVRLWDLTSADPAANPVILKGRHDSVFEVAISPDSTWLLTIDKNRLAYLWHLKAQNPGAAFHRIEGARPFAFSADSRWLTTTAGGTVYLYDLTDPGAGVRSTHFPGNPQKVRVLAIDPESRWLAVGGGDNTIRLWDLIREDPSDTAIELAGHSETVNSLAISPNGRWLVSGSNDGTVRLWPLTSEGPETNGIVLPGAAGPVAFSPDSAWLVTAAAGGGIGLWEIDALVQDAAAEPVVVPGMNVNKIVVSPDGSWLVARTQAVLPQIKAALLLNRLGLNEIADLACETAGRNLSADEWQQYFPRQSYTKTCPNLPGLAE